MSQCCGPDAKLELERDGAVGRAAGQAQPRSLIPKGLAASRRQHFWEVEVHSQL